MLISSEAVKQLSTKERFIIAFFALNDETSEPSVGMLHRELQCCMNIHITANACEQICQSLVERNLLAVASHAATVISRRYMLAGTLDGKAMEFLITEQMAFHSSSVFRRKRLLFLKALLRGGREIQPRELLGANHDPVWYAVCQLANMADQGYALPTIDIPAETPDFVYRIAVSTFFCLGLDITPFLADWHAKRKSGARREHMGNPGKAEYAALCIWTGHPEWLDLFPNPNGKEAGDLFVSACRAFRDGDLARAYKESAAILDIIPTKRGYEEIQLTMPASILLALAITAFHKPAKTRIERLASRLIVPNFAYSYNVPIIAQAYFNTRARRAQSYLPLIYDYSGIPIEHDPAASPMLECGHPITALVAAIDRNSVEKQAPRFIQLAERAFAAGYPTLAGIYLSVFGWAIRGPEVDQLANRITAAGGFWFRQFQTAADSWKLVVAALDKCLPASGRAKADASPGQPKSGRIIWALNLFANDRWNEDDTTNPDRLWYCSNLEPCFRGPRSAANGSQDKPLPRKALMSGKYDSLFSETDQAIIREFQKNDGSFNVHTALDLLCGYDALTRCPEERWNKKAAFTPITLTRRDIPLAVTSAPDDGITLTIEPWCLEVNREYALRRAGNNDYLYYPFSKAALAMLEIFRTFGTDGSVTIPKAGMGAMRPLLTRMAAIAPIQGELAAVGGGGDLPRIAGETIPLARLEFGDTGLAITLRIKPLKEADELIFVPGAGQPERMVARHGETAVLVRDLAAEKASAATVQTALAECESWADGEYDWFIDSFVDALRALAALKGLGEAIRMEWRKGKRLTVAAPQKGAWRLDAMGGADFWFSVKGEFKLDNGKALAITELLAAFKNRQGEFLPFGDGEYLRLTNTLMKRLEALEAAGRVKGKALEIAPAAIPMLDRAFQSGGEDPAGMSLPETLAERADAVRQAFEQDVTPPNRFKAELRPYQVEGYTWLSRLATCGFGACLADDMGLGKTVQIIALLLERAQDGASLVIAPASVCGNWRNELARFAPTLRPVMAWDEKADAMNSVAAAGPGDVVIAGYGLLVTREGQFAARAWNGVILDEAQAIKNETSKRAHAAKSLHARFRVAATGTPVENRLTELWSISDFLNPGLLGPIGDFTKRFTVDGHATPALKRLVSPLILRRLKRDVLDDLPEKTEITLPVILGEDERAGYETCRRLALETLAGSENRIQILAELTRLRRYCCHPSLALGEKVTVSAKMETLLELLENLYENQHRALIFSQFTDYLAIVRKAIDQAGWSHLYLDGQTPASERERLVNVFQRGEGDFFLISLKAGGIGLNLTAANYVILLDPWWNPAVENQAADRVHRIGQREPVTVYRLIASDTVEERVIELHREKKAIAEDVLGATASSALTPDELMRLFR